MLQVQTVTAVRARTERWNAYTKRDNWNPNEYPSIINFRGDHVIEASTQRPYIHSLVPKCLCKQGTTNINIIIKEQKMSSTCAVFQHGRTGSSNFLLEGGRVGFDLVSSVAPIRKNCVGSIGLNSVDNMFVIYLVIHTTAETIKTKSVIIWITRLYVCACCWNSEAAFANWICPGTCTQGGPSNERCVKIFDESPVNYRAHKQIR